MKVIMLVDVKGIGKKDSIVEVKDGYAANFLIPNKKAVRYCDQSISALNKQKEDEAERLAELKKIAEEVKEKLEKITLEFVVKSSSDGRMCGTISLKQIDGKLKSEYGIQIDKRKIIDKYQVNAFGITNLKIELFKGVIGNIKIHVSEEK